MAWRRILLAAVAMVAMATGVARAADGDAAKGEIVFKKCVACHTVSKPPKNTLGPSLVGVMGRTAGGMEGFKYSDAMKDSKVVWDEKSIDAYLKDPKNFIPKNKMVFVGLPKEEDRNDVIAYLKQATK